MQTRQATTRTTMYQSEELPNIQTTNPQLGKVIAWADRHSFAWQIVCGRRSKAFGLGACTYIGWAQNSLEAAAVLERVRHLHEMANGGSEGHLPDSIWRWRAKFTLEHFAANGFTGGFFQQHDAKYPRSCLTLDYTPETLEQVLDTFCRWIDRYHDTARITVDGHTVRDFPEGRPVPCAPAKL